jgi:large subunit ribosomal protein L22
MQTTPIKKISFAHLRFIKISPLKVKRILNLIRYKSYKEALLSLEFLPYRATKYIWQLLYDAVSNFKKKYKLPTKFLKIKEAFVNKGPVLKRIKFIARGRVSIIKKKTSHIKIIIGII